MPDTVDNQTDQKNPTNQNLINLTKDLKTNLKVIRPTFWLMILICCIVGFFLFWMIAKLLFCSKPTTWIDLIIAITSISALTFISYKIFQSLISLISETQQENKKWQTKIIDAYGKLLEDAIKPQSKEKPQNIKDKEAEVELKKLDLELAKLECEIAKYEQEKKEYNS